MALVGHTQSAPELARSYWAASAASPQARTIDQRSGRLVAGRKR
jgi:hypothetical protein